MSPRDDTAEDPPRAIIREHIACCLEDPAGRDVDVEADDLYDALAALANSPTDATHQCACIVVDGFQFSAACSLHGDGSPGGSRCRRCDHLDAHIDGCFHECCTCGHRPHARDAAVAEAARARARAEGWDEGYGAGHTMAHLWGHVDYWEDEPENPHRALSDATDPTTGVQP